MMVLVTKLLSLKTRLKSTRNSSTKTQKKEATEVEAPEEAEAEVAAEEASEEEVAEEATEVDMDTNQILTTRTTMATRNNNINPTDTMMSGVMEVPRATSKSHMVLMKKLQEAAEEEEAEAEVAVEEASEAEEEEDTNSPLPQ